MAEPNTNERMMNVNDFPDHLLVCIISFLPTLDAVRTSFLSRKWRNLWTSLTSLTFDFPLFPASGHPSSTRRRFADFVDRTLILRPHTPLSKFRFQFHFYEFLYCCHIDSWIQYAVKHNATELDIDFFIDRSYHIGVEADNECCYEFPFYLLKDSCVRVLKLCRQDLILPLNMASTKFVSITSMSLDNIFMPDVMVTDLISACINLELLYLEDCYGMNNFRICSPKLKELILVHLYTENEEEGESLEISAPNLRSITLNILKMDKYTINNSSSLVEAHVSFPHELEYYKYWSKIVRLFSGVKRLSVQNWWFKLVGQKDVSSERYALNNLNHLELKTGYTKYDLLGIAALLEIAPNLNTMVLNYLPKIEKDESISEEHLNKPIHLSMPNLKLVKMQIFDLSENVSQFLLLLQKLGVVLERVVIVPAQVGETLIRSLVLTKQCQEDIFLQGPPHFEVSEN